MKNIAPLEGVAVILPRSNELPHPAGLPDLFQATDLQPVYIEAG